MTVPHLERQLADYLADALDDDRIGRRAKTGARDRGDISGLRTTSLPRPMPPPLPKIAVEEHFLVPEAGEDHFMSAPTREERRVSGGSTRRQGADPVMDTNTHNQRREPEPSADITSCVVRVANLDRSLKFYCDVFACRRLIRDADMALLSTAKGFLIYLHQKSELRPRGVDALGVTHLMWATDSEPELHRIAARLRGYDTAAFFRTVADITIVEGVDPDGYRVIVACPSARQLPRTVIADRLRG